MHFRGTPLFRSLHNCHVDTTEQLQKLFKFVTDHAVELKAYDMEKAIFSRLMQVGQAALKSYFALKGTGDVGPELEINGVTLSRAAGH